MKFASNNRPNNQRLATNKKKKSFTPNTNRGNSNPVVNSNTPTRNSHFSKLVQQTTFLSRSPSHTFQPETMYQQQYQSNSHPNQQTNQQQINFNPAFKNFQNPKKQNYKKSKNIKICSNPNNKGNFAKGVGHQQHHYQQYPQKQFVNSDLAANNLANMLQSELTINLTKHEPRMVLFNNNNTNYSQQPCSSSGNQMTNRFQQMNTKKNSYPHSYLQNRFKYVKPTHVRTHAPYNTTQYIMYDYSKRRSTNQVCITNDPIKQFSDDWNMTLVNGTANVTESLNKLANKPVIDNANALIELSGSLEYSSEKLDIMAAMVNSGCRLQQLSSSL